MHVMLRQIKAIIFQKGLKLKGRSSGTSVCVNTFTMTTAMPYKICDAPAIQFFFFFII